MTMRRSSRRYTPRRRESSPAITKAEDAEWRYRWLGRYHLFALAPGVAERILDARTRLDASEKTAAERLTALQKILAAEAVLEEATRFVDGLTSKRQIPRGRARG